MILKRYNIIFYLTKKLFTIKNNLSLSSFISKLTFISLTLSIGILIMVMSIMNGFEFEFKKRILNLAPHSTLLLNAPSQNWPNVVKQIEAQPYVLRSDPSVRLNGLMNINDSLQPLIIKGVKLNENHNYLKQYLTQNNNSEIHDNEIIFSTKLANDFNLKIGDKIKIFIPKKNNIDNENFFSNIKVESFILSNTFYTGTEIDNYLSLIDMSKAMLMKQHKNAIQEINVQYLEVFKSKYHGSLIANEVGDIIKVSDWSQEYGGLYHTIKLSRDLVLLILGCIILVSVFNLHVTMTMIVKHKSKQISILKTLGLENKLLIMTFLLKGCSITFLSIIIGTLIGLIFAISVPYVFLFIESLLGFNLLSTEIYPIDYLPSKVIYSDIIFINFVTFLLAFLSTLFPAIRASNINPSINLSNF